MYQAAVVFWARLAPPGPSPASPASPASPCGTCAPTLGKAGLTLEACVAAVNRDRPAFLNQLRDAGVPKLADRQGFANAIAKALRAGWLRPPYKGPFTEAGRELRIARDANPGAASPQIPQWGPPVNSYGSMLRAK